MISMNGLELEFREVVSPKLNFRCVITMAPIFLILSPGCPLSAPLSDKQFAPWSLIQLMDVSTELEYIHSSCLSVPTR